MPKILVHIRKRIINIFYFRKTNVLTYKNINGELTVYNLLSYPEPTAVPTRQI